MNRAAFTWGLIWLLISSAALASAVAAGVIVGLALAPRVSAATLRSATVIPAAPSIPAAMQWVPASTTAEPDQWRTGAPPARPGTPRLATDGVSRDRRRFASGQVRSGLVPSPPGMARHAADSPDVAADATTAHGGASQTISGVASTMGPGWPADYLALPEGPGWRVRICGPSACIVRTSTDAGPALAMQRAPYNRIADLSMRDFELVAGVPWRYGLTDVTVHVVARP